VFGSRYGFENAYFEVDDLGVYLSSVAVTIFVLMACMATIGTIGIMFRLFLYSDISCNEMR
jgi:hypothetical protein